MVTSDQFLWLYPSGPGQHLHISLSLHSFWGLCVRVLQVMLGCGYQYVQMLEFLVLQDGQLERHCRLFLLQSIVFLIDW
jgi:hypothetical protein